MGEHKENETALASQTFPRIPPVGRGLGLEFGVSVIPKQHILLMKPGDVREEEGRKQVRKTDGGWQDVPEGAAVHLLGEPMLPEDCDVTLTVVAQYANLTMRGADGQPAVGQTVLPMSFGRMDMKKLLERCEASLPTSGLVLVR